MCSQLEPSYLKRVVGRTTRVAASWGVSRRLSATCRIWAPRAVQWSACRPDNNSMPARLQRSKGPFPKTYSRLSRARISTRAIAAGTMVSLAQIQTTSMERTAIWARTVFRQERTLRTWFQLKLRTAENKITTRKSPTRDSKTIKRATKFRVRLK